MTGKTITVGVPSSGHPKIEFINSLLEVVTSGLVEKVLIIPRLPVQQAREQIVKRIDTDFLLFIDDDMSFTAADVAALIKAEKPVVSGLYHRRSALHPVPVVLKRDKQWLFTEAPTELSLVDGAGLAFTLINRGVFEVVGKSFTFDDMGEDINFMEKCYAQNIEVWVEPAAKIGHIMEHII